MAYVQPSGTIQLFKGINLDNRYMHTLYFATTAAQTAFFDALVNANLSFGNTNGYKDPTGQMYTRPTKNSVRLHINAELVQNVTYMRFNNRSNKWYYCFVLATNYVNENVTDIIYEIDVMQTWFIQEGSLQPSMVLREHVTNDTFGLNLEAEPIGSEVYDQDEITCSAMATDFSSYYNLIAQTTGEMGTVYNPAGGGQFVEDLSVMMRDGIFDGTQYSVMIALDESATHINMSEIKNFFYNALGSWDKNEQKTEVTDLYMFPSAFVQNSSKTYNIQHPGQYDNYTPQNNKLFGYPFAFLLVTTNDGSAAQYRWEYFDGDVTQGTNIQFDLNANSTGGGSIEMHPHTYNGMSDPYDSKIVMDNFPKCAYNYNAYQAFVAAGGQTKLTYAGELVAEKGVIAKNKAAIQNLTSVGGAAVTEIASVATGNVAGAVAGGVGLAGSIGAAFTRNEETELKIDEAKHKINFQWKDAFYEPNIQVGRQCPNIAVGKHYLGFRFMHVHVRDDEMVRLDNFLTMYGYAVNTVKVPNLTGRPYWNFVQTKDCMVKGNMPASSKAAIARIFDGGIFFWNSAHGNANIGNFNQSVNEHGQIINK